MSFICIDCIGDKYLRNIASKKVELGKCSYCGKNNPVIRLNNLAIIVDSYIRKYHEEAETEEVFDDSTGSYVPVSSGISLEEILNFECEIKEEPAEDLSKTLEEMYTYKDDKGKDFYNFYSYYPKDFSSEEYSKKWNDYCRKIKHESRFFNESAKELLKRILVGKKKEELSILEIGPTTGIITIYRARVVYSAKSAREIQKNPKELLGSPTPNKAKANRMNPEGIRVFYGAMSEKTTIAEVRPTVGSLAVVGKFEVIRKLKLIDLSKVGYETLHIFHPNYEEEAQRKKFLRKFQSLISRPINPADEPLEYIPTQAISEYVYNTLKLDGILYGSTQLQAVPPYDDYDDYLFFTPSNVEELKDYNIVLFGGAALIEGVDYKDKIENRQSPSLTIDSKNVRIFRIEKVDYATKKMKIKIKKKIKYKNR